MTAASNATSEIAARKGCNGCQNPSAPEVPSASNTILLHTGQATANMARPAPPIAGADLSAPGRCRPK